MQLSAYYQMLLKSLVVFTTSEYKVNVFISMIKAFLPYSSQIYFQTFNHLLQLNFGCESVAPHFHELLDNLLTFDNQRDYFFSVLGKQFDSMKPQSLRFHAILTKHVASVMPNMLRSYVI